MTRGTCATTLYIPSMWMFIIIYVCTKLRMHSVNRTHSFLTITELQKQQHELICLQYRNSSTDLLQKTKRGNFSIFLKESSYN